MSAKKPRSRRWHPLRSLRRAIVFVAYDVLHTLNLVGDGIAAPIEEPDAEERPRRRRLSWRMLAAPLIVPLRAVGKLLGLLASQLELRAISGHFYAFLDNWGLLDDAIDGHSGLSRRLVRAVRFMASFVVRIVPWLRVGAFMLLSELLYHLGLINDSVDAQRVWTRKMTLSVLPAVLGALVAIGLVVRVVLTATGDLGTRYATAASQAIENKDHALAALWLTRLVKQEPRQPVYRYELAVALDAEGKHGQAWAMMETLAPTDRAGYSHAHLWLAKRLCEKPNATVADFQAAWRHLSRVLRYNPHAEEVHALLARVLVRLGHLADAETHLKQGAAHDPELQLLLAAVYAREGKRQQSETEAKAADQGLSKQLGDSADESEPLRLRSRLVDAKVLAGDFAGAQRVLAQLEQDDPVNAKVRLSQLYLAWYDALGRAGSETVGGDAVGNETVGGGQAASPMGAAAVERRELLKRSLDAVPWNLPGLERLLQLTKQSPAQAAWAAGILEKMDWKTASAEAHLLFGLDQWKNGERALAREHLEAAYRVAPHDIRTGNNLAWVLAHDDPPELKRALELANETMTRAPGQSNLLDTRGRIFFKLGRWSEALHDFEALAAARPEDKQLHELLADCYGKLDMPELADFQRRLATNTTGPKSSGDSRQPADTPVEQ